MNSLKLPFHISFGHKMQIFAFFIAILMTLGMSVVINYTMGFYSVFESESYFRFFLGDHPFLIKLFYYPMTDLYYRARELSTLIHIFDTYCILWMAKIHIIHLLSVVYYLLVFGILMFALNQSYASHKGKFIEFTTLLSLCYLTTPAIFLSGFYFNPSKTLVAFDIGLGILLLSSIHRWKSETKTLIKTFLLVFLLTIMMGISDEQGIIYSLLFMLYAFFTAFTGRNRLMGIAGVGFIAGNACILAYRSFLGPFITYLITGLSPTIWGISDLPAFHIQNVFRALQLIGIYLHYFFGSVPIPYVTIPLGIILIGIFLSYRKSHANTLPAIAKTLAIAVGSGIFFTVLFYFLMLRLEAITWPEFSIIYYPIPFYTFLFFVIHALCLSVISRYRKLMLPLIAILILWLEANLFAIPKLMTTLESPQINTHVYFHLAPILIQAIENPEIKTEQINFDHYETINILRKYLYGTK
jgi:hypothetical protein